MTDYKKIKDYKKYLKTGTTAYDFEYFEKDNEETITITAILKFKKKSKLAQRMITKSENKQVLPLTLVLKDIESDLRAERRDRELKG
ncbi:MAG: hypothetical protein WC900_00565 [Oscillospiraceae bacterium]|jgi:hypothetical protein